MRRPHLSFVRTDIWREGKWLDLWSVVHFLSGLSVALGLSVFDFGLWPTFIIATLLFIAYEMWEAVVKIEETPQNRFMDVIVGQASFLLAYAIGIPEVWAWDFFVAFGVILAVNLALAALGWQASQKAAELEKRMLARLAERRARYRAARERRRMRKSSGRDINSEHGGGVA